LPKLTNAPFGKQDFGFMTMADLKTGQIAEITGYTLGNAAYRAKLLALGLTSGVRIKVVNVAPLGDPMELAVRGYHLSLRRDEAKVVKVRPISAKQAKDSRTC
jgi:ferrous iron transport protein A